jgi:hypothetical protein
VEQAITVWPRKLKIKTTVKKLKQIMALGIVTLMAPLAHAQLVNFHFGALTQTGGAALGKTGDIWNANNLTNGNLLPLKDSTGAATSITVSWTSGETNQATGSISSSKTGTPMDVATTPLMCGYAESSAVNATTFTNLSVTISGLAHGKTYTLALYGAGDLIGQGSDFTIVGASTAYIHTLGINRMISDGSGTIFGNAYGVATVVASSTGTVKINARENALPYTVINGFQLALGTITPNNTMAATTPAPIKIWGVCGHPTQPDYASRLTANVATQMSDLKAVGAGYYRVSVEGQSPSYLDYLMPQATTAGITLLLDLPVSLVATNNAQTNYNNNYAIGYNWAAYAISKGYAMPYWELGNEPENAINVSVLGDGASPAQFPDKTAGGFVAIASGLQGAYDGVKQAYADGRASGKTTITPQCLIGMCFRHWGLLAKIQAYDGELPCDIISWHWYGPTYGDFNAPVSAPGQPDDGRSAAACLADFKSKTNPAQPMDVWITETNRSQVINGSFYNGSTGSLTTPRTSQDFADEATALKATCDSFKKAANVKAVFAYELYDEVLADQSTTALLASQGYFGLITGLNGTKKAAFTTFQTEISSAK